MKRILMTAAVVLPLMLNACGDDKESSSKDDDSSAGESLPADQAAVKDVLVQSLLDPSCDLLTDDYLLQLSVLGAETVDEACDERLQLWQEPQFSEDDILVSDIVIEGDRATAVVGSEYVNITTTYELMMVDGSWRVSCDDFTCEDLEPSPEVS